MVPIDIIGRVYAFDLALVTLVQILSYWGAGITLDSFHLSLREVLFVGYFLCCTY